jgi:ABC-type Na+ efflux pump permease subunit
LSTDEKTKSRRWTVIGSGLLCAVLALIVLYTNRGSFTSPRSIVVVAAVGVLALFFRLRAGDSPATPGLQWLNLLAIAFALAAVAGDLLHLRHDLARIMALLAVGCFAVGGALLLHNLRKRRSGCRASSP